MLDIIAQLLPYVAIAAMAYGIGGIPMGTIVARLYGNVDLTKVGSTHTGATNAMRTLGLRAGLVVLALDLSKGMLAVALARFTIGLPSAEGLVWLLAVVGHMWSIFLRGHGGRGVGTGLGGLAIIAPPMFFAAALTGCVIAAASRYVSLGSIVGSLVAFVLGLAAWATGRIDAGLGFFFLITPALVVWAHADNIDRIRKGTERRLTDRGATGPIRR